MEPREGAGCVGCAPRLRPGAGFPLEQAAPTHRLHHRNQQQPMDRINPHPDSTRENRRLVQAGTVS